jgi:hypothetical protein
MEWDRKQMDGGQQVPLPHLVSGGGLLSHTPIDPQTGEQRQLSDTPIGRTIVAQNRYKKLVNQCPHAPMRCEDYRYVFLENVKKMQKNKLV